VAADCLAAAKCRLACPQRRADAKPAASFERTLGDLKVCELCLKFSNFRADEFK
jgi:hypothetical protein